MSIKSITRLIPAPVRARLRRLIKPAAGGLDWIPAPCIEKQAMSFRYQGKLLRVEADYSSPLYETIAELVDYDAYHLKDLDWASAGQGAVFDIGGNIGVFSLLASCLTQGQVFCVEPAPANGQAILHNAALNQMTRIELLPCAVAGREGEMWFQPHPTISVAGRLHTGEPTDPRTAIRVQTLTLDQLLQKSSDGRAFLVKIDCEGGEYDIMEKLTPETAARIQHLTFEVHDQDRLHNVAAIRTRLEQLGYRVQHKPDLYGRAHLHHLLASRP
jgi:FkbM family methyltransferase